MSKKKAVVIPIDDYVKIVFGNSVKSFKLSEAKSSENSQFMDRLFSDFDVLTVEQISALSKDEFDASIDALVGSLSCAPTITVAPREERFVQPAKAPQPPKPQPPPKKKFDGLWFKSMADTMVILNDVDAGKSMRNGVEFTTNVIIYPNRAINLARYDKDQLKKSTCLRKLINDGDLIPCSQEEASLLEKRFFDSQSVIPKGFGGVNGSYYGGSERTGRIEEHADVIEMGGGDDRHANAISLDVDDSYTRDDIVRGESIDDLLEGT